MVDINLIKSKELGMSQLGRSVPDTANHCITYIYKL